MIRLALKNLESWQKLTKVGIYLQLEAQRHHIRADAGKLEQILSNLIGNALKFTPIGGRILIVTRNEGGELVIEVSDTGIGISAEALRRIFSPFEQGDSSIHPRFGGLGLGLSIARTLTAAHAGTLEVKSDGIGKGANFTLRFKVDDSAPQAHEEEPRRRSKESRLAPGAGVKVKLWNQPSSKMALSSPCNTDRRREIPAGSATWRRCDQSACSSGCRSIALTG